MITFTGSLYHDFMTDNRDSDPFDPTWNVSFVLHNLFERSLTTNDTEVPFT